ncbi:unnamed protein product [Phytomonas sp. EM1]|nr:unnamed protein product [Phytomonas sp. EM1]|eukprot:CCW61265.1 unnamed protein product [Phytomonas sp. isolate EM1]
MIMSFYSFRSCSYIARMSPPAITFASRRSRITSLRHVCGNKKFFPDVLMFSPRTFHLSAQLPQTTTLAPPHVSGLARKGSGKTSARGKSLLTELERPTIFDNEGKGEEKLVCSANLDVQKISGAENLPKTMRVLPNRKLHRNAGIGRKGMISCLKPSQHMRKLEEHLSSCRNSETFFHALPTSPAVERKSNEAKYSSFNELEDQQSVLRETFDYAFKNHRVRLRKDPDVYRRECAAYCRDHSQMKRRRPTAQEVRPYTEVTLASVEALRALAHLNPKTSSMHTVVQQGLLLQQSVMNNQLMLSNQRVLVRCLRCFHVYPARPRTLWGTQPSSDDGVHTQHSWYSYQLELEKARKTRQLRRCPRLRKQLYSIGHQRTDFEDNPTCCPFCGSPKAQWAMEYVHNRTHARSA